MSDAEYDTTDVPAKPKKERTPAQKAATARALEALAAAREAKKAEKATVVKRTTTTTKTVPKPRSVQRPPPRAIVEHTEVEEPEYNEEDHPYLAPPKPVKRSTTTKPVRDISEDLEHLKAGMRNVVEYVETKKAKAKPKPKADYDESSSDDEPVKKRKTKPVPAAPGNQFNTIDPQEALRSLFWRNM
jgi:hypothetical protein